MNSSAGKGDPYWYEWTVGLRNVVEMLHPESAIESVSFQVTGAKGWDDVVVRHTDGHREFIQVKHSRAGKSITFGDLVSVDSSGVSLLGSLFAAWREMKLRPETDKCVLYTNRTAGESPGRSANGVHRPPLFDFSTWLHSELNRANAIEDIKPAEDWKDAWKEWLAQLSPGTPEDQFAFLKSFEVQANQEDLEKLEASVLAGLVAVFQIPHARAIPLFQALDSSLRRWTTSHETVTAEDAYSAMALDGEVELEHRAPPPPAPFFPSRNTALARIEVALKSPTGSRLLFLCAEPGAGKTSLVSQLSNCRVSEPLQGIVGLRYFAFRPITPNSPLIPPDADHFVRPDRLWFSLLSQLRRGLKGKLRNYGVPLRNDLLNWSEARSSVLRISDRLGREMKHPFVIVIDGIDHAARAMRYEGTQAKDFFASLPGPDEIGDSHVRLMLAGQPPESYPEYPIWLRSAHPKIETLSIGQLDAGDIGVLLREAKSLIPGSQENASVRVIEVATRGNTLAVVFAVEEARSCSSVDELQKRLTERHLQDGLREYYNAIWQHALKGVANLPLGTEIVLATALCLTSERLSGDFMSSAFKQLGLNPKQWQILLGSLGPLVVLDANGFRVLHNDVRVFLHGLLSSQSLAARRQGASMLADYYMNGWSSRWFAHKSLLRLLRDAGREVEWARVFNVGWVFEAAALGIPYMDLSDDCAEALRQGTILKDWDAMLELACATETLERWEDKCEYNPSKLIQEPADSSPPFLHTEAFVKPVVEWHVADLQDLIRDAELLMAGGENARARALVERWLGGLSVADLCHSVAGLVENRTHQQSEEYGLSMGEQQTLESLGSVSRSVGFNLKSAKPKSAVENEAESHFETGWVFASCGVGPFDSLANCFANRPIRYLSSYETALRNLASEEHWTLVRALMAQLQPSRTRLSNNFKAQAAWWALQSDAALDHPGWLDVLAVPHFGLSENPRENLIAALATCYALNWKDAAAEPSAIANNVFGAFQSEAQRSEAFRHYKLLFRAAATLGRVLSVIHRRGVEAGAAMLPPSELTRITVALWEYNFTDTTAYQHRGYAGEIALKLVDVALRLGAQHQNALIEAAKPIADKCPVDHRRQSVWLLFYRSGDIDRLRRWIRQWLAADGWLWQDDASSRESIAEDLLPLARQLGENDLAAQAEDKLRWLQITYRGHKDYTFQNPISWFEEMARLEPKSWRDLGLRLWTLSEAASALGADNRCSWDLGEALGAAAWSCDPVDVWRMFSAEYPDCGSDSWLRPTANRIVGGLSKRLHLAPPLSLHDRLTGWCFAVGLCRWFNDEDTKALVRLREALLDTAQSESERSLISTTLDFLTPGESRRAPRPDSMETGQSENIATDEVLKDWLFRIEKGEEIHPCKAASLLEAALSERPTDFQTLAGKILDAVGVGAAYGWGWDSTGSHHAAVLKIGRLVSDELLWKLVKAAVKYAGEGSAWSQGTCRNLYCVLLARAARKGVPELRVGLSRLLQMHERWAGGGRGELELPAIILGADDQIATWSESTARCLAFLLASRSAEVIESTLIGIQALVSHDPKIIGLFFKLARDDTWKKHWILNSAEVWVALHPKELNESRVLLETWLTAGPLHLRLQAWIVLCRLAEHQGAPPPSFPHPTSKDSNEQEIVLQSTRQIMTTPVTQHGSIRLVDHYHSAESTIERVEHVTSANLDSVRSSVSERLLHAEAENFDANPWPVRIRGYGDMRCSSLQGNLILDEAFDDCFRKARLPTGLQGYFAQAYLGSENPWMLRATPIPDADPSNWPSENELSERSKKPVDLPAIRRKIFLLATQHAVAADEIVLAARVQVFTWCEDFIFRLWWEEGNADAKEITSNACPTTMSGRTFVFDFDDWWEPLLKHGKRPVTFAVGGHQRLAICFPEFMPARLWRDEFGWRPAKDNPLIWLTGTEPVARYECIHGVTRLTQSGHPRQPVLGRWLVKKAAWKSLEGSYGPFRIRDDFQRFSSNVER